MEEGDERKQGSMKTRRKTRTEKEVEKKDN